MEGEERRLAASLTARYSEWVLEELDELRGSFLLTDPAMPGHPIVYASRGLAALTGYPRRSRPAGRRPGGRRSCLAPAT